MKLAIFKNPISLLIQILDTATQIFDDVTFSGFGVINLDFSKAFDLVDHSTLLTKMTSARLSKNFIDWLRSYLSDRSYRVKIQGILSGDHKFLRGVPQGSVLGPALFSTLVGDLPYDKSTTSLIQYADDATFIIPFKSHDPQTIRSQIDSVLTSVTAWCFSNKQSLNVEKSKLMLNLRRPLVIEDLPIPTASSHKTLGVLLNNSLTWDDHITMLYKKACRRLYILRAMKMHVNRSELHSVYLSFIRSLFDYCCPIFTALPKKLTEKIRRVESRSHRIIFGDDIQCECSLDGLQSRREEMCLRTFSAILRDENHLLYNRLPKRSQHSSRLQNFPCRTNKRQNSFFPLSSIMLNRTV